MLSLRYGLTNGCVSVFGLIEGLVLGTVDKSLIEYSGNKKLTGSIAVSEVGYEGPSILRI